MKKILFAMILVAAFAACSDDSEIGAISSKAIKANSEMLEMLSFRDSAEFLATVATLENGQSMTCAVRDFNSLYDEYEAAWEVEEEYYASLQKYSEFKKMFPHLYFPEYEDDYSFFLPVSDENVARLINPEGNVMIGGKVVSCIDIKTPQDLLKLGKLYPSEAITRGLVSDPALQNKVYMNNIPKITNQDNDRRMWVETRVVMKGGYCTTLVCVHFNKKAPLGGWKKYNSNVTLLGKLIYASGSSTPFNVASTTRGKGEVQFPAVDRNQPAGTRCTGQKLDIQYQGIEGYFHLNVDTDLIINQ